MRDPERKNAPGMHFLFVNAGRAGVNKGEGIRNDALQQNQRGSVASAIAMAANTSAQSPGLA